MELGFISGSTYLSPGKGSVRVPASHREKQTDSDVGQQAAGCGGSLRHNKPGVNLGLFMKALSAGMWVKKRPLIGAVEPSSTCRSPASPPQVPPAHWQQEAGGGRRPAGQTTLPRLTGGSYSAPTVTLNANRPFFLFWIIKSNADLVILSQLIMN